MVSKRTYGTVIAAVTGRRKILFTIGKTGQNGFTGTSPSTLPGNL